MHLITRPFSIESSITTTTQICLTIEHIVGLIQFNGELNYCHGWNDVVWWLAQFIDTDYQASTKCLLVFFLLVDALSSRGRKLLHSYSIPLSGGVATRSPETMLQRTWLISHSDRIRNICSSDHGNRKEYVPSYILYAYT